MLMGFNPLSGLYPRQRLKLDIFISWQSLIGDLFTVLDYNHTYYGAFKEKDV